MNENFAKIFEADMKTSLFVAEANFEADKESMLTAGKKMFELSEAVSGNWQHQAQAQSLLAQAVGLDGSQLTNMINKGNGPSGGHNDPLSVYFTMLLCYPGSSFGKPFFSDTLSTLGTPRRNPRRRKKNAQSTCAWRRTTWVAC